ncbi:MAG: TonB-dependent receptor [Ignavibacteriae bacterium]|nr:TonB-dependent receptor [Ignavibacteriota bacterium]
MKSFLRIFLNLTLLFAALSASVYGQSTTGTITGTIRDGETKETIPNVNVRLKDTSIGSAADINGKYAIENVPPGQYTILVTSVGYASVELPVDVQAGEVLHQDFTLASSSIQVSEIMVYGASLRRERITDAPAAVSVIDAKDITRGAGHGQLPKLLESEPGVDMTQSGLYDFNVNTRGFNSSLNRRLLILLDGRDLGTAFLSATEWNAMTIPLEELGRIELVRGPGSALYGANAYNGVLNISSLPPKANLGTRVIIGGGELNAYRADVRHAGTIGAWGYRVNAGLLSGKTFSTPRTNLNFEYPGLNPLLNNEVAELNSNPVNNMYGQVRLDYEYLHGGASTIEGGFTQVENEVIVTGIGRVQVQRAHRPWARVSYTGHGLSAMVWTNGRFNSKPEKSLATGLDLIQDALISHGEIQYNFTPADNLTVTAGASHRVIDIDTEGTLMTLPRTDNLTGIFSQAEYKFDENFKGVIAARWDRSSLTESFLSPKAALVWMPVTGHTFRATFNKAFQSPNYSELYLYVKHPTRPLAYFGNPGLKVEKITGYELGYKGIIDNNLFLTVDAYFNQMSDFISDLGPGLNPAYPDPIILPGDTALRNIWSYTNSGKVNEGGFEVAANYYLSDTWHVSVSYSQFVFEVVEKHQNDALLPNSPDYKVSGGVTYTHPDGHDASITVKYVPSFQWAAGIFRGPINTYTLVNLSGTLSLTQMLSLNVNVSNVLNTEHYQIFGGSLLKRRAMATLTAAF